MDLESDGDTNCNWCTWNGPHRLGKWTGRAVNWRSNGDHPNYTITKIGLNTEKSPGDLTRLALTQIPIKDQQLSLDCKTQFILIFFDTGVIFFYEW